MSSEDEAWLTALVAEHHQALRTYLSRKIDRSDVDDVVAEVLAAA